MTFEQWKQEVDKVLLDVVGQGIDDLPTTISPMEAYEHGEWAFDYAYSVLQDLREEV
jgi:hypothetical protein